MTRIWVARVVVLGMFGFLGWAYWQGTPEDVVEAVRRGDVAALTSALGRDPENVHTKVYPQAYASVSSRQNYTARTGESAWEGRYIVHDAVEHGRNAIAVLDVLAAGGVDLTVRLKGRTLLHLAAEKGDVPVATWLVEHGADVSAGIDCDDGCPERGYTALHSALAFPADAMIELLVSRGANLDATGADGRTPLHTAADRGHVSGALVLVRHGADLTRTDASGKTAFDLAGTPRPGGMTDPRELAGLAAWWAPDGKFAAVSAAAKANGSPPGDEYARRLMDEVEAKAAARAATAPASK